MEENSAQNVTIEQQKKITMTAVESVDGFTAQQITLTLSGGGRAIITGDGLKIINFSKSNGNFGASGKISGVRFADKKLKISKRLFG